MIVLSNMPTFVLFLLWYIIHFTCMIHLCHDCVSHFDFLISFIGSMLNIFVLLAKILL